MMPMTLDDVRVVIPQPSEDERSRAAADRMAAYNGLVREPGESDLALLRRCTPEALDAHLLRLYGPRVTEIDAPAPKSSNPFSWLGSLWK